MDNATLRVRFTPSDLSTRIVPGADLLTAARAAGVAMESPCGGNGGCGKCKTEILSGEVSPITERERELLTPDETARGTRLACLTRPLSDVTARPAGVEAGAFCVTETDIPLRPEIKPDCSCIEKLFLPPEHLRTVTGDADAERVAALAAREIDPAFLPELYGDIAAALREESGVTLVTVHGRVVRAESGDTRGRLIGVAADIGTTTVAVSLVDIRTGAELAGAAAPNPQRTHGADVLSRLAYAGESEENRRLLQSLITGRLGELIRTAAETAGVAEGDVCAVAVAANTTMAHLLLGADGASMGTAPYRPAFLTVPPLRARRIGLFPEHAALLLVPSVSAYVGGDTVAGVLATGMDTAKERVMLIDIGTNGELILGDGDGGFTACSCAAGPALEGMNIDCGGVASAGAIASVRIDGGELRVSTTDDAPPTHLCGSGVVDAVAALLDAGVLTETGRFADRPGAGNEALAARVKTDGFKRFVLARDPAGADIYLSQKDVRQVQLAKAAIASAIEVMHAESGFTAEDTDRVLIAGGFGKHLRLESLLRIGCLPAAYAEKTAFVGNTARSGAAWTLLHRDALERAAAVRARTRLFDLSASAGYDRRFLAAIDFAPGENDRNA